MNAACAPLEWRRDGADWPNRDCSRWIDAGGVRWHYQRKGEGPAVLLLHGTGAATHSWRDLLPALAARHAVMAPDLPGHGFSSPLAGNAMTLPAAAESVAALLRAADFSPQLIVGHSAGAAIAARLCLDARVAPRAIVSLNGALLPWSGVAGPVFSMMARVLAAGQWAPRLVARRALDPGALDRLLATTGSQLDRRGRDLYQRLVTNPGHVGGVLQMMAGWDLHALERDLPRLATPLLLVVGLNDRTVSPGDADRVQRLLPAARVERLPGLGHLAHEEQPARVVALIEAEMERATAP